MYDFSDIIHASKDEQVRAWAIEQAIEFNRSDLAQKKDIVETAADFEKFIKEGAKD